MKYLALFEILFVIFLFSALKGQWDILNEGGSIRMIDFVNENVGWVADYHSLMKTEDGGEHWKTIPVDKNIKLIAIDFINEYVGWAIVQSGTESEKQYILKTEDCGQYWTEQKLLTDTLYWKSLYVVNDTTIYAFTYGINILKSTNGGENWTDISPGITNTHYTLAWFFDTNIGIVTGVYHAENPNSTNSVILRTSNGGISWEERTIPGYKGNYDLQFINDSTGYFRTRNTENQEFLCVTTDTLNSWEIRTSSNYAINSFCAFDDSNIIAIMSDSSSTGIFKSRNGGLTWGSRQNIGFGQPMDLYSNSPNAGYLTSFTDGSRTLWKTVDRGSSWKKQIFTYPFNDVCFLNNTFGFASGGWFSVSAHSSWAEGNIFVTKDGGMTWENLYETGIIEASYFLNDEIGYVLSWRLAPFFGRSETISKTTDSGETWVDVYEDSQDSSGYFFTGKDICFIDEQLGWAVGNFKSDNLDSTGEAILCTADGGNSWELVWKISRNRYEDYTLNSICSIDTTAWAVGERGLIVKYTEQDQWQLQNNFTDLPLNKVFFSDEHHGWISGGYHEVDFQSILLKTNDGGQSWKEIRFDKYLNNDMFFVDSLHGWTVGQDTRRRGMILETFDGGEIWNPVVEDLSAPLTAIYFKDGYGWAVGGNGLVLRYDVATDIWMDENNNKIYPTRFTLHQNYPNPFNPSTLIQFAIPKSEYVELKVYNILGKEVSTNVSKKLNQGNHTYTFDGKNLASGIYYYQLVAGEYREVKKMILLN